MISYRTVTKEIATEYILAARTNPDIKRSQHITSALRHRNIIPTPRMIKQVEAALAEFYAIQVLIIGFSISGNIPQML
jgi:hypothetical protein